MGHCVGIAITASFDLCNRVFNMALERLIFAGIREGNQLCVEINVLQPEGCPTQVAVRVDVGSQAYLLLRHHEQGVEATNNQRSHEIETEGVYHSTYAL